MVSALFIGREHPVKRTTLCFTFLLFFTVGCAHQSANQNLPQATSHNQYAPKSFVLHNQDLSLTENHSTPALDPLYLRTQADYYFSMGEAQSLEGNTVKAIESFKSVLIYDAGSLTVRVRLATEFIKSGLISEALEQALIVIRKDPQHIQAHLLLGSLYSSMKNYPKALSAYATAIQLQPDVVEAYVFSAAIHAEQKNYDQAVKTFQRILSIPDYPNPHLIHYYVGRVLLEQKKFTQGIASLDKALALKPRFTEAVLLQAQHYIEHSKNDRALKVLRDYHLKQEPHPKVAEILVQLYLEKENYDEAFELFSYLENTSEDALNIKLKMALILIQKKMFLPASVKLEEILAIAPDSDKVRFYLGAVYEELQNPESALKNFKLVPSTSSFYQDSLNHSAYLLKKENRSEEALGMLEKALNVNEELTAVFPTYVTLLEEKGDFAKAIQFLGKVLKKNPENNQLRFYYGSLQDRVGNKDAVVEEMKIIIENDPRHAQALNYLAFTWAEMNVELNTAEIYAARALEIEPKDPYILDTLGWIYYKQNRYNEAIKTLEAAFKFNSTVSIIAEHLGDVYMKAALTDKARNMYIKAIALESDPKKIQELQSKVSSIESQKAHLRPRSPASISSGDE